MPLLTPRQAPRSWMPSARFLLLATLEGLVMAAVLALTARRPVAWSSASCGSSTSRMASSSCSAPSLAWFVSHAGPRPPGARLPRRARRQPARRRRDRARSPTGWCCAGSTTSRRRRSSPRSASATSSSRRRSRFYGPDARPVAGAVRPAASSSPGSAIPATSSRSSPPPSLLLAATWLLLTRTRIGLVMRATQWDRETAHAFGIAGRPGLCRRLRARRHARRGRRRADRADPARRTI